MDFGIVDLAARIFDAAFLPGEGLKVRPLAVPVPPADVGEIENVGARASLVGVIDRDDAVGIRLGGFPFGQPGKIIVGDAGSASNKDRILALPSWLNDAEPIERPVIGAS